MDTKKQVDALMAKKAAFIKTAAKGLADATIGKMVVSLLSEKETISRAELIGEFERLAVERRGKPNAELDTKLAQAEACIIALRPGSED